MSNGLHYTQVDPKRSNLPRDPVTGKIIRGPGNAGTPRLQLLAKHNLAEVFEKLGGVEGMLKWAKSHSRNRFAFYTMIYPRLLGAQTVDEAAEKLAQRPQITRIENLVVRPGEAPQVIDGGIDGGFSREAEDAQLAEDVRTVRDAVQEQIEEAGADPDPARQVAQEMVDPDLIPL
jgi:hypothetical protein